MSFLLDRGQYLPYIIPIVGGGEGGAINEGGLIMPTVKIFSNFSITMYFEDEGTPHFHVRGPGFGAKYAIKNLDKIRGSVPSKVEKKALKWAAKHKDLLIKNWEELSPRPHGKE